MIEGPAGGRSEWTNRTGTDWQLITPGEPQRNGVLKRFNGKLRDERPKQQVFASLAEAWAAIERWRLDYNHVGARLAHGG